MRSPVAIKINIPIITEAHKLNSMLVGNKYSSNSPQTPLQKLITANQIIIEKIIL